MKLTIAVFTIIVFVALNGCKKDSGGGSQIVLPVGPVAGKTYSVTEVAGFKQLTVRGQWSSGTIVKLPATSYIYLEDTTYPYMSVVLDSIIANINAQTDTNLVLKRTTNSSAAIINVYLRSRDSFENQVPASIYSFINETYTLEGLCVPNGDNNGILNPFVSVFVDMQKTAGDIAGQSFLLHHEMMHALGFFGHTNMDEYMGSIMYYYRLSPPVTVYSYFDKRMMKLLYNPAILPGINENELNAVIVNL